jgi:glycosyltransferase involved in cell wall biosynthesis
MREPRPYPRKFGCFYDPAKITSGQRFFTELARALDACGAVPFAEADVVLFNVSAPVGEVLKARLRGQEVVVRLDGIYHDRLSPAFIGSFRFAPFRALLRIGARVGWLAPPLSKLANLLNRNYGAMIRALLAHRFVYQSQFSMRSWSLYMPRKPAAIIVNGAPWRGESANAVSSACQERIELVTTYDEWKPAKRIDEVIEFVSWANEVKQVPIRLTILGFTGVFPKTYTQRARDLLANAPYLRTMPRFASIEGVVSDVFQSSHAYITFSFRDPCPNVVVEAMSSGLPVVATASGGMPDIVGDAGRLIPLGDDEGRHFYASRYESEFPPVDFQQVLEAVCEVAKNSARYRSRVARRFARELDIRVIAARYAAELSMSGTARA